jgi:2-keto-4-pentenoate hydratase/2-oxohepta-3-ene-1,7-dioic acid hydratase in catechol pathway
MAMKLYTFEINEQQRLGAEQAGRLVDLNAARAAWLKTYPGEPGVAPLPADILAFLRAGAGAVNAARETLVFAAEQTLEEGGQSLSYSFEEVRLLAPIPRPGKILCSGINYLSHKAENPGAVLPTEPFFFAKAPSVVIGPGDPIIHPGFDRTQQVDYEVEFAVVIGRTMRRTPEDEVMAHIAGYTILHDVSARDVQFKDNQITLGKNFDTFAPLGPCIVTTDDMPDPDNKRLRTYLNGQLMQDGSTSDWLFPLPRLLSFLSRVMTLEPGDVISTGTPAGVGVFRKPQVFLKPADVVVLEIEGIGRLENLVVAEA